MLALELNDCATIEVLVRSAAIGCINVPSRAGKTPVKIFKVSPRVYVLGMERLQVGRTAIGFVSSNSWDIAGPLLV